MSYHYRSPTEIGFVELKASKRQVRYLFPALNLTWMDSPKLFYLRSNGTLIIEIYPSLLAKLLATVHLPFHSVGSLNPKLAYFGWTEYVFAKKYGTFERITHSDLTKFDSEQMSILVTLINKVGAE